MAEVAATQSPDPHRNGRNNSTQSVDEALIDLISETLESPLEIANKNYYTKEEKSQKLTKFLQRACSNNDLEEVQKLLENVKEYLDLDKPDADGTPPLVYASCFGYVDIVRALVESGASVNVQDKIGWPALMWATNNNHEEIVKILLENGASPATKTAKGRTVVDIINHGITADNNQKSVKLTEILSYNFQRKHQSRQSVASCFSLNALDDSRDFDTLSISSVAYTDPDGIQDEFAKYDADKVAQIETLGNNLENMLSGENDGYRDEALNDYMSSEFVWDQCMPDQMYVFNEDQVPHILSTVVANMKPMYTKDQKLAPANVIFLCARFAHYYSTPDLLDSLLNGYIQELTTRLRKYSDDPMLITFWMANTTQLLYYIKKDTSLVTGTVEHQLALSELVHEIYQLFVKGAQNKLHLELNQAILNCETIPGLTDESKFGLKKTSFLFGLVGGDDDDSEESPVDSGGSSLSLRRTLSLRRKPKTPHAGINGKTKPSPSTITNILGNTLFVLQTYEVHPMLVHHILNQLIYFISCHLFNQILKHKKYCCRSRAMQIRMNITNIEDWIRNHGSSPLVHHLNHHFKPLIQLLQLLQIFSSHTSSQEFIDTLKSLEELNPLQIKRASENYRYETDEPRVPDEVYDYIKVISDQVLCQQLESKAATREGRMSMILQDVDTTPTPKIAPQILITQNSEIMSAEPSEYSPYPPTSSSNASPTLSHRDNDSVDLDLQMAQGIDNISIKSSTSSRSPVFEPIQPQYPVQNEFKDPNHLLPFSIPTQSEMASFNPNKPGNVPAIPEDIIGLLDNKKPINGK